MRQFQQELTELKQRVLRMGGLAESMVADASAALASDAAGRIETVRRNEPVLDRFQVEIDREAVRLITIYTPVARDLRFLLMIVRINSELERMGDQAMDNCEYAELLGGNQLMLAEWSSMSAMVLGMVHEALRAFDEEDTRRAQEVMRQDERVDALNAHIFRQLLDHPGTDPRDRARTMSLILMARSLERIADHATNICEEVYYLVEGADIRHQESV
jgi:phosphate transport system protein